MCIVQGGTHNNLPFKEGHGKACAIILAIVCALE